VCTEEHLHLLFVHECICVYRRTSVFVIHTDLLYKAVVYKNTAYYSGVYFHSHGEVYLSALQINDISNIPLPPPSSTELIRMTVYNWLVPAERVRTYPLSARSSHEDGVSLFFLEADVMFFPGEETAWARAARQEHLTVFRSHVPALCAWLQSESVMVMFSPLHSNVEQKLHLKQCINTAKSCASSWKHTNMCSVSFCCCLSSCFWKWEHVLCRQSLLSVSMVCDAECDSSCGCLLWIKIMKVLLTAWIDIFYFTKSGCPVYDGNLD